MPLFWQIYLTVGLCFIAAIWIYDVWAFSYAEGGRKEGLHWWFLAVVVWPVVFVIWAVIVWKAFKEARAEVKKHHG